MAWGVCVCVCVEQEEKQKQGKVVVKRKWWVLAQSPYSLQGNWKQSPGWKWKGDRSPYAEDNPGSRYRQRLGLQAVARAHSRYIHVKQE